MVAARVQLARPPPQSWFLTPLARRRYAELHPDLYGSKPTNATPDLWSLPGKLSTGSIADRLEYNFYVRCPPEQRPLVVQERHPALASGVPAAQGKERDEKTLAEVSSAPAEAKEGDNCEYLCCR